MSKKQRTITQEEFSKYEDILNFLEYEFEKKSNYSLNVTTFFTKNSIKSISRREDFILVEYGDKCRLESPAYAFNVKEHLELIEYCKSKLDLDVV